MIHIYCRTNLDLAPQEHWPTELPTVPRAGDLIQSGHRWPSGFQLQLRVAQVTWRHIKALWGADEGALCWVPEVELGLPCSENVLEFHHRYRAGRGAA